MKTTALQYIYTSCSNNKNGGYDVFFVDKRITDDDCKEIYSYMRYDIPYELPSQTTDDEIEKIYPKKISYFKLPSGRMCLAQTTYCGLEYNSTNRFGNYIIHALIFEEGANIQPLNILTQDILNQKDLILDNIFIQKLELPQYQNGCREEEWAPRDIQEKVLAIEIEVKIFLEKDSTRVNVIKSLLQSIVFSINSCCLTSKNLLRVHFYDEYENMSNWIQTLNYFFTKSSNATNLYNEKITFCTHISNNLILPEGINIIFYHPMKKSSFNYDFEQSYIRSKHYSKSKIQDYFFNVPKNEIPKLEINTKIRNSVNELMGYPREDEGKNKGIIDAPPIDDTGITKVDEDNSNDSIIITTEPGKELNENREKHINNTYIHDIQSYNNCNEPEPEEMYHLCAYWIKFIPIIFRNNKENPFLRR
jgi:hypothetical protein